MAVTRKHLQIGAGLAAVLLIGITAVSQPPQRGPRGGGDDSLQQPFRGVAADGKIETGLFRIKSTGVTTAPVVSAAEDFLAGLKEAQRDQTIFPVDDSEWRKWDNRHRPKRQGVGFDEMDVQQRGRAFGLLRASLSAKGLKLTQDIMKLNGTLAELTEKYDEYGEWLYWITIMGEPSPTEPWGWQLDGHHLVINYFVLGDQVVMSPVFVGSEPVHATSGKFQGTIILQDEQNKGLQFMQSLNEDQQKQATISEVKDGNNALAQAYEDNLDLDYAGLECANLDEAQTQRLLDLIALYVGNMKEGHAAIKMEEVKQHLDRTYFAWVGSTQEDSVFYYRIHSPVILIEFDHQNRVAPFRSREPSRDHIHAVVRTPNGNDYGKDLLRQHYEQHHNSKTHAQ